MTTDKHPPYLKPVPSQDGGAEAAAEAPEHAEGTPGLTAPLGRGRAGMFLTDVIVELGHASRNASPR